ncbi:MAG: hypothetical protein K0Q74_31 [Gammaproteobacteria bacterium]|nr:hypothetical protein [Gammaproteobacteria bacterium]
MGTVKKPAAHPEKNLALLRLTIASQKNARKDELVLNLMPMRKTNNIVDPG